MYYKSKYSKVLLRATSLHLCVAVCIVNPIPSHSEDTHSLRVKADFCPKYNPQLNIFIIYRPIFPYPK